MFESHPMYAVSYHKPEATVVLTWQAGTAKMDDEDFRQALEVFAEGALQHHATRVVIDVRLFKHRPSSEILAWRDATTVPKYNDAGVKKLAWIWPGDTAGMKPSSIERDYDERYCSSEEEALAFIME